MNTKNWLLFSLSFHRCHIS